MKSWSFRKIIMKNHGSAVSRNFRQPVPSQPTKTPPSQHFDSIFTLANLNKSEEAKKYERKIGKICLPRIRKKANEWKMFGNGFFISLFVMVYFNDLWLSFSTDFFRVCETKIALTNINLLWSRKHNLQQYHVRVSKAIYFLFPSCVFEKWHFDQ